MVQQRTRVVFLGDSVTAGFGVEASFAGGTFVDILRRARHGDRRSHNNHHRQRALDGIDTAYALKRFNRLVTRTIRIGSW